MSKRELILEAALELFIQQGFEKTPTSAISKAAGVATGTLFHHFKTKEDLISALYLDIKLNLQKMLITSINQESLSNPDNMNDAFIQESFHNVWLSMNNWVLDNPSKFKFVTQFSESAHINSETRERVEHALSEWTTFFEKGKSLGTFSDLPTDLLVSLATNHIFTSCEFILNNPQHWNNESFKHELLQSCWSQVAHQKTHSLTITHTNNTQPHSTEVK